MLILERKALWKKVDDITVLTAIIICHLLLAHFKIININ